MREELIMNFYFP